MTTQENASPKYDVFISYSHYDEKWVCNWLLPRLVDAGLRVCIDFRDFQAGRAVLINIEDAVKRSRKTLIVLTPAWVRSEWTAFESLLLQTKDPAGRKARMIPLMLKPCELPERIAMLTYVDFTRRSERKNQLRRLIEIIGRPAAQEPEEPVQPVRATPCRKPVASCLSGILRGRLWPPVAALVALLAIIVVVAVAGSRPGVRSLLFPARPTPVPLAGQVLIEVDGTAVAPADTRCVAAACGASQRLEVRLQDATGARLPPDDFLYTWRFDPPDPGNSDLSSSKNYAVVYAVPCDRDNQTVTVEVLRDEEPVAVRRICFNIDNSP